MQNAHRLKKGSIADFIDYAQSVRPNGMLTMMECAQLAHHWGLSQQWSEALTLIRGQPFITACFMFGWLQERTDED